MFREQFLAFGRPSFDAGEIEAVTRVMRSGWVGMGQETIAFEQELGDYLEAPHVVSVNSCTSALFLSLLVLDVQPGDEVICPSLTWCSTANAALYLGATPVLCDVDPATLCITPETVAPHVTSRTKAVMAVHMGGRAVDVAALRRSLPRHVAIVEDAAHAIGSTYADGRRVGSSGNLTCFSFYANKNLSTGEGGAVALYDGDAAERLRSLRQHGLSSDAWKRFTHASAVLTPTIAALGYKANYTDLQAAIGRVQLRRQPEFALRRLQIAERYHQRLDASGFRWRFQQDVLTAGHARHLMVAILPIDEMAVTRNDLLLQLRRRNIGASVHYRPLHTMPLYRAPGMQPLPNTDWLADRLLTLPISASMAVSDVDDVIGQLLDLAATASPVLVVS